MERKIPTILGFGVILVGGFFLPWVIVATLSAREHSYRSAQRPNDSEEDARRRGTFVARVPVRVLQDAGAVPGGTALEGWVEWEQRLEYAWLIRERFVNTDRAYFVARVPNAFPSAFDEVSVFAIGHSITRTDTVALHQLRADATSRKAYAHVTQPFPDSVSVFVQRRPR